MNSKILNVVIIVLVLSSGFFAHKANAGLIIGDLYEDVQQNGVMWEYVGEFDLVNGPHWSIASALTGLEVAELFFGVLSSGQYALSSQIDNHQIFKVNHEAWYDSFADSTLGVHSRGENAQADNAGTGVYNSTGNFSAYVNDRAVQGFNINYVFRSVTSVPEPSTLLLLTLGMLGFASRQIKK